MVKASVIVSTFDQPNSLKLCLEGYSKQSFKNFEMVISDDGSDNETLKVIEDFRNNAPFKIKHVWQHNKGYRRAKVHNMAVLKSIGQILIFSDGDCIPDRDFVLVHTTYCKPRAFCLGGYVRLGPNESESVKAKGVDNNCLLKHVTGKYRLRFLIESAKFLFHQLLSSQIKASAYGANISVWRDDFFKINGFDENYDNFGREDSDLKKRLLMAGVRPVSIWTKSWVYHLDDKIDPKITKRRIPRKRELERLYYYLPIKSYRCSNGLNKAD